MMQRLKKKKEKKWIYFCKNFKPDMEDQSLPTHSDAENESRENLTVQRKVFLGQNSFNLIPDF